MLRAAVRAGRAAPLIVALALTCTGTARAHDDDVELGVARYYEADFEQALAAFARAEAGDDLTRDDLVRLLFFRALVNSAFGSEAARDLDLLRLASLAPSHAMNDAPPPVREAFDRVRRSVGGQLAVEVIADAAAGGCVLRARAANDPGGLARTIVITAHAGGEDVSSSDGRLMLVGDPGTTIEYTARVIGPGGAVMAERRSSDAPLAIPRSGAITQQPEAPATSGDDVVAIAVGVGIGVAVAAAIAIVLAVVLAPVSDQTQLSSPAFFMR